MTLMISMPEDWTILSLKPPPTTTGKAKKLIQSEKCSGLTTLLIPFNSFSSDFHFSSWDQLTSSGKSFTYSSSHPSGLETSYSLGGEGRRNSNYVVGWCS